MDTCEDTDRVARILAGDVEAFSGIVNRWQGPLVSLAFRYCRDHALAEELAQDAFLKIYRNLGKWRGDAAFSTWLFAVAINVFRSWYRRRKPATISLEALELVAGGSDTAAAAEAREVEELVREAVLALPGRYRDALILFYFRDTDVKSAAAILGIAEGTLKSHLHRGRKLLADRLPNPAGTPMHRTEPGPWTGSIEYSSLNKN